MPELGLSASARMRSEVIRVGAEQSPVLVVDNFVDDPEAIVAHAESTPLTPPHDMYPGMRAPTPIAHAKLMKAQLTEALNEAFSLPDFELHNAVSYMCVVTTPREKLDPVQCMPHIDGTVANDISGIHYLCSEAYDGTSMYRHRRTGYEVVADFRHQYYRSVLDKELHETPWETRDYINGDTPLFERIASLPIKFNRVVFYRSSALHSANIGADFPFDPSPRTGRFSINFKLQMRPRGFKANPWFGGA